jgi:protein-tyrosine phosphatase
VSKWFRSYGFAEVGPCLFVGAYPLDDEDVLALEFYGIKRVLNLVEDTEYTPGTRSDLGLLFDYAGIEEHRLSLTDFGNLPAQAIEEAVRIVNGWLDQDLPTYLHCRAGWQRSAALAAGVIAVREGLDIDAALEAVHQRKPSANPLPHQREDLHRWWSSR